MGVSVEVTEGLTLTIHHNAFYNDEDISEDEVIRGLKEGEEINPADYAWDKDFLTYLGSSQDFVTVSGENDNQVDLYYKAVIKEEAEEEIKSNRTYSKEIFTFCEIR